MLHAHDDNGTYTRTAWCGWFVIISSQAYLTYQSKTFRISSPKQGSSALPLLSLERSLLPLFRR